MPLICILGFLGLLGFVSKRNMNPARERMSVFLFSWLLLGWISISTQHTPSLRYLTALIFPLLYFAKDPIVKLLRGSVLSWSLPKGTVPRILYAALLLLGLYQLLSLASVPIIRSLRQTNWGTGIVDAFIADGGYFGKVLFSFIGSIGLLLLLVILAFLWKGKKTVRIQLTSTQGRILAGGVLGSILLIQMGQWGIWKRSASHYMRDASIDLADCLGEDARLMGPYAPALGLDNRLPTIPFLGRYEYENAFFEYGITHMVIVVSTEKTIIKESYPEIYSGWSFIASYPLRMKYAGRIRIYRLPSELGGRKIHEYELSLFELAVEKARENEWGDAVDLLREHTRIKPGNADGHYSLGVALLRSGMLEESSESILQAIDIREERFLYHYKLGEVYSDMGNREEAIVQLQRALELNPDEETIQQAMNAVSAGSHFRSQEE